MARINNIGLYHVLAIGVGYWCCSVAGIVQQVGYRRSAIAGIYKSGLYSRLATDVVQWCAFLHKTEHNNELQKTDCSSVALFSEHWHALGHNKEENNEL